MELLPTIVILVHPIAALTLIWSFMKQRKWRQKRRFLKSNDTQVALKKHVSDGNKLMFATVIVIALALLAEIFRAMLDNSPYYTYIMPNNFHASGGLLGLLLMTILWRSGHSTKQRMENKQSFSKDRDKHGRISDIMTIFIIIHAFLGFLYLLQII